MRGLTQDYINGLEVSGDFSKIQSLLTGDEKKDFFLGVRKNYMNIYYKGMSIAKIEKRKRKNEFKYSMSAYYREGIAGYEKKEAMPSAVFWDNKNMNKLKTQISKHVFGYHEGEYKLRLEKVCQQRIMNQNNWTEDSEWYYIDMEYVYDATPIDKIEKHEHPYGRADMIAIKKKANKKNDNGEDVHDVAFVELKVGSGAYKESFSINGKGKPVEEVERLKKEQEELRKIMKEQGIYNEKLDKIKLGSGVVSHIADFLRLFAYLDWYQDKIREELINMLAVHKKMGLIKEDSPLAKIDNVDMLASKPDYYVVSYGKAPSVSLNEIFEKKRHKFVDEEVKEMKRLFFAYLYTTENSAENLFKRPNEVNNSDDIDGIRALKDDFEQFCETDAEQIECIQQIKGEPFRMVFRFIDGKSKNDALRCLD